MKMSNYVHYLGRFLIVDIVKPLFEGDYISRVRINKEYADKARLTCRYLVVRVPKGEIILFPKNMKKLIVVKEVFLRPDEPMKMYEIDVPHCSKCPDEFYEVS